MGERHYAGVYWEDRPASREECVASTLELVELMRATDPLFARWFLKLATREESETKELAGPGAEALLKGGLVPMVDDGPSFGFKVSLWNGRGEGLSAHFDLNIGAHLGMLFNPTPNSCLLQLPRGRDLPEVAPLLRRGPMTALLARLARWGRADWGIVSTDSYLYGKPPPRPPHHPRVGWLTFLNGWRGAAPRIPETAVTPVDGLGYVVGTRDEEFSHDDDDAVTRISDVEEALRLAGSLGPVGAESVAVSAKAVTQGPLHEHAAADGAAYSAALDAAVAVDTLSSAITGRRADLTESLLRASTALVVSVATGEHEARAVTELRALLDLVDRLFRGEGSVPLEKARAALDRLSS